MKGILYILIISFFLCGFSSIAWARKKKEGKKEVLTSYQKIFQGKDVKTSRGLMTIHKVGGKVYAEFPLSLMGKDMLLVSSIEDISDNGEGVVGQFGGYSLPFRFVCLDSTLQARISLLDKPLNRTGEQKMNEAIDLANAGGVYASFKIEAYAPDSTAVVVDMTPLFLEYSPYTTPFADYSANSFYGYIARVHEYKKETSFLKGVKAYQNNVMVSCELGFVENMYLFGAFQMLPADKKVSVTANKMLLLLPEEKMNPRLADPRLGVSFMDVSQFQSDKKALEKTYFTRRWRIEPGDEIAYRRGELVEPKKPIVFYMDTLMPSVWKSYVKEGVEAWNEAFEKIGFKNVVRVVDFPKNDPDFNANNISYSTIRYAPLWMDMQRSMTVDPRTGEILNASLYLYDGLATEVQWDRKAMTMASDPSVRKNLLSDAMVGELIRTSVMREIGINLGLVINAGASCAYPADSLRSPEFTRKYGLSPSIMDYVSCNFIAQPGDVEKGVRMTSKGLGEYDYYVIKWLYQPIANVDQPEDECKTLDSWIKAERNNPNCRFGKMPYYYYDPTTFANDLGDDPFKALQYTVNNLKLSIRHFYDWYAEGDLDQHKRSILYNMLYSQLQKRINDLSVNLGGFYQREVFDDENMVSYTVVPKAVQKATLKCMVDLAKDLSWLENKETLRNLEIGNSYIDRIRGFIFGTLTFRLKYVALGAEKGGDYSVKEYVDDIYKAIWEGTIKNRPLEKYEMDLQREFLGSVIASSTVATNAGNFVPKKGLVDSEITQLPVCNQKMADQFVEHYYYILRNNKVVEEESGFYPNMRVVMPSDYIPVEHYFEMLFKVQNVLNKAVQNSTGDTKLHYEYLLYKIRKMLDKK